MLKLKTALTVVCLYEIITATFMHVSKTCNVVFGDVFCADSPFKYFVICIAVPLLVLIGIMWWRELIAKRRRKNSVLGRARYMIKDIAIMLRDRVAQNVSAVDLEKVLMAALVFGIRKYAEKHPQVRNAFEQMVVNDNVDNEFMENENSDLMHREKNKH
ncbi:MAG: hypothetical protein MJ187_02420 [Alphaproteobacteria bacterium]|nr:hypothetical protein [Alphaproteobacteria bacterium]